MWTDTNNMYTQLVLYRHFNVIGVQHDCLNMDSDIITELRNRLSKLKTVQCGHHNLFWRYENLKFWYYIVLSSQDCAITVYSTTTVIAISINVLNLYTSRKQFPDVLNFRSHFNNSEQIYKYILIFGIAP